MLAYMPPKTRSSVAVRIVPYVFMLPALLYIAVFVFWPICEQIWLSLTNARLVDPNGGQFVGMRNYARLLHDSGFYGSLRVTVIYTLLSVVFGVLLGVIAALAIDRPFPGRTIARSMLLFGWAVPNSAAALIWLWMYNERSGVFNQIATHFGAAPISWLTTPQMAMPAVVIVSVWQVAPFVMLVVLAALQSVPEEQREAARIDGADALNVFRYVTFPHIRPAVQLAALLVTVWAIRRFDIIFLLTGGGPLDSTATIVVKLRQIAFENYQLGRASAYGVIGLALALLVGASHFLLERRRSKHLIQ